MSSSLSSIGSSSIGSAASPAALSASVPPSISRSMRILNSLSVGSWRIDSAPVRSAITSSVPSRPSLRVGLDGDREPQVEVVVAQVVVRDARVRVDELRRAVRVRRIDLGRDEHRGVAERARVEDRRDLADDPLVEQVLDALEHLVLGQPGQRRRPPRTGAGRAGSCPCIRLSSCLSVSSSGTAAPSLRRRDLRPRYVSHRGHILRVVGDDDVGAGAADAGQRLEHGGALVEQAGGGGGLEHGVLAADVVGGDGQAGGVLDAADHVEVGQRGLDHDHVGALGRVELGLAHAPRARWPGPSGSRAGRPARARTRPPRGTGRRTRRRTWRSRP